MHQQDTDNNKASAVAKIKAVANKRPFPTIGMEDFRKNYLGNVTDKELLKYLKEGLGEDVATGKLSKEKADEIYAVAEIKALSTNTRYHFQHVVRNHMQIIAGLSEERIGTCLPFQERLKAISAAVQTMNEDLRRLGL